MLGLTSCALAFTTFKTLQRSTKSAALAIVLAGCGLGTFDPATSTPVGPKIFIEVTNRGVKPLASIAVGFAVHWHADDAAVRDTDLVFPEVFARNFIGPVGPVASEHPLAPGETAHTALLPFIHEHAVDEGGNGNDDPPPKKLTTIVIDVTSVNGVRAAVPTTTVMIDAAGTPLVATIRQDAEWTYGAQVYDGAALGPPVLRRARTIAWEDPSSSYFSAGEGGSLWMVSAAHSTLRHVNPISLTDQAAVVMLPRLDAPADISVGNGRLYLSSGPTIASCSVSTGGDLKTLGVTNNVVSGVTWLAPTLLGAVGNGTLGTLDMAGTQFHSAFSLSDVEAHGRLGRVRSYWSVIGATGHELLLLDDKSGAVIASYPLPGTGGACGADGTAHFVFLDDCGAHSTEIYDRFDATLGMLE